MWQMNKDVHVSIRQRFCVVKVSGSKVQEDKEAGKSFWKRYRETIDNSTLKGFLT